MGAWKWYYCVYDDDYGDEYLYGWQRLDWSKGTDWFYFDKSTGEMLTGSNKLDWSKGTH